MLSFDHLVHFVQKPEQAVQLLKHEGFHAGAGGRHESLGTVNALCYFGLSYIEFLGIEHREVTEQAAANIPILRQLLEDLEISEGPGTIAIRTNQIDELAVRLSEQGLSSRGPIPGSRNRADGSVLRWSSLLLESEPGELPLPFFIEWEETDEQRRAGLIDQQLLPSGKESSPQLVYIGFIVPDAEQTADKWTQWFGLPEGTAYSDEEWQAEGKRVSLQGGDLLFLSPTGPGKAKDWLPKKGPRPYIVGLQGTGRKNQRLELLGSEWHIEQANH